jgi:hypothetical protein
MPNAAAAVERPGGVSIVLQGPLDRASIADVAARCAEWRRLFPMAQLVCAVSSHDGTDTGMIERRCDVFVRAAEEPALPPIKTDSPGPNNVNRMIATARAGIAQASGRYVLRIRSDLLLRDRSFVALYDEGNACPRGDWALFEQRVLIPEVFTLNPFTLSRMPFHYSDWFHFGLRDDVAAIWEAAWPMTPADATHYARHPHRPGSNIVERRFRSRLAPEQTVHFPLVERAFPRVQLAEHNDCTSIEESMLFLADNFVVANLADSRAAIAKYQHLVDRMSHYTRLECLSQVLVRERARRLDEPAATVFADLIAATARYDSWASRLLRAVRSRLIRLGKRLRA